MRVALSLAAALALAAPALAAPAAKPVAPSTAPLGTMPTSRELEKTYVLPADGPYQLDLTNIRGRIVVKRWNKNALVVRATVRAGRPLSSQELAYFHAATIDASLAGDTVTARTTYPGTSSAYPAVIAAQAPNVLVEYMVAVPPETAVIARQEYGPIVASGTDGRLELFSRDGDVSVFDAKGWIDAGNERGKVTIARVDGDAVGRTFHGTVNFKAVTGDVRAIASTGTVRIDVPPRWAGEVSYHTVSGAFRSDLATFATDLEPGDTGYVGTMRGPLADGKAPLVRIRVDTASGDAILASDRSQTR